MSPTRLLLAAAAVAALSATSFAAQAQAPATTPAPATAPTAAAAPTGGAIKVQGDLLDTLKLSGQFTTFVGGVDATNLASLLKTQPQITVFAPTDAAFASMPAADLAKLKADKAAMQKFILHHLVNAPIDSTKIKGAKGEIPSAAGDKILLDGSDEGGKMMVDGATIVQADLKTASGLLQVVDKPLIVGAGGPATPAAPPADAAATAPAPTPTTK